MIIDKIYKLGNRQIPSQANSKVYKIPIRIKWSMVNIKDNLFDHKKITTIVLLHVINSFIERVLQ